MTAQIKKIQAHAEHLLKGFLILRERYEMLVPMLFDADVIKNHGTQTKYRGFICIKNNLFLFCCQDISKLCLDNDDKSPSIKTIVSRLQSQPALLKKLEDQYAVSYIDPPAGEKDTIVLAAFMRKMESEEAERRVKFNELTSQLHTKWSTLSSSHILPKFKTIRDKAAAHIDVHLDNGKYQEIDIGALGIKWEDIGEMIFAMQDIVELIGLIVRAASFSWDDLDRQLKKIADGFWRT